MNRRPLFIALGLTLIFATYFSWFTIGRHWKTNSGRFDLGNVEQVVWNFTRGHGFMMTDPYGTAQVSRFVFHADPFLIVLTPFYAVAPFTETLLLLQVLAVASGAIAIYLIASLLLKNSWWGVLFSFLYILNPGIQWATIFDVHAVTFAAPLILWAIWSAIKKKYWLTLLCVVFAMLTKEEIGLGLAVTGVYVWARQRNRNWGIVLTFLPLLWSLAMFFLVLPQYRMLSAGTDEVYQTVFGTGAVHVLTGAAHHPLTFLHQLFAKQNLIMAWQLLAPTGFFSLGSLWSLGAVPDYGINALSLKPAQHLIISHYTSGLTGWLMAAAVLGVSALLRFVRQTARLEHHRRIFTWIIGLWLLGWSGYSAYATGPLPKTPHDQTRFVTWSNPYARVVRDWAKKIPSSAAVSVTNNVGSQFARREHLFSFPLGVSQSDYIVVLEGHTTPVIASQTEVSGSLAVLRSNAIFQELYHQGDLTILRRK